ncbi:cardiolipin synthase [soil metagenome]
MPPWLQELWPIFTAVTHFTAAPLATAHAVILKRETPSVIGWVGLIWLAPVIGSLIYAVFGVNRIQRIGVTLQLREGWKPPPPPALTFADHFHLQQISDSHPNIVALSRLGQVVTGNEIMPGNKVDVLQDGDAAYPAMLAAIDGAQRTVALLSYIFDSDRAGDAFLDALVRAQVRGVEIRVLIDHVGARYSKPNMVARLRKAGITTGDFLPTGGAILSRYLNLRNHRKILVVDGTVGFTGGTNIREGHWLNLAPAHPARCLHFRLSGPVVGQLMETFTVDWLFATKEELPAATWFPSTFERMGDVAARGVSDGPDEDLDKMSDVLLGALAAATTRAAIVSPYFLPDNAILRALVVTALRGVRVDIVIPARNNIRVMDWAPVPQLAELLAKGCHIHLSPPPFDHTKLFVIDGVWSLVGSTNWDARSLRLNFEYNVECYSEALATDLEALIAEKIAASSSLTLAQIESRPLPIKVRDGLARLLSPYL